MKLTNIVEEVSDDYHISPADMEVAFKAVSKGKLDQRDIKGLAAEVADEAGNRSPGSFAFILNRMHVLVHGEAPSGYSERSAEKMFNPARSLIDFVKSKGIDVEDNIRRARIDLQNRVEQIKQPEATQLMSDFYTQNKELMNSQTKQVLRANRNQIIADIMAGVTPEAAFRKHGWASNKGQPQSQEPRMESNTSLLSTLTQTGKRFSITDIANELAEQADIVQQFMDLPMLTETDESDLDTLIKQMEAAKRGLSIISKLKPSEERGKHVSRVMSNMNKIRGKIATLKKQIAAAKKGSETATA